MASPSAPQHEPTMEEILASIRKIISEDTTTEGAAVPVESTEPAGDEDVDVLELTQEVASEPAEAAVEEIPAVEDAPPENASLENDVVFEEIEEMTMTEATPSDEGIFSDKTRSALDDALAGLDEQPATTPAPAYAMPEGDSVQAVFERAVRDGFEPLLREHLDANTGTLMEHMKPLIREWMDEHFPTLLENAVRTEVARAVAARGRR
jgi:cell pole-organizing protein PopZ